MDGKGAWRDNVFVERLWRSVKYEEVYLHAYDSVSDARASLGRYLDLYNRRRPLAGLLMGTFRVWLVVNPGAFYGGDPSVAGGGVQAWSSRQPEATRCNNSLTKCCSFCSRELPRFSSLCS